MTKTYKLLIVDDEPRLRQSLASLLKDQGFDISLSDSGRTTRELLKKNAFDVALLDLFLPDVSGQQIMSEILEKTPDTLVIIMTGYATVDSAVNALKNGAYDYLQKPFEPALLTHTVQNALARKTLASENRDIHHKLAASKRDYQYLVENSPDIIYMLDPDGRFTFVNPSIEPLTGLAPDQVIGRHYSALVDEHLADSCQWVFNERRTGSRAKQWNELEMRTFESSGAPRKQVLYAELQSTGIYQQTASPDAPEYMGTHGVIRDITQKKITERKKRKIKAQLQRAEKMEVVGTLASGVAHDLNNLLSSVMGYPELLLMDMAENDPHRDYIEQIKKSGEKAAVIVKDMLTLARRNRPAEDIFSLDTVITDCLTGTEYSKLRENHPQIKYHINLNSSAHNMKGSGVHIGKCVMNLLTNAAEAMPGPGQIVLFSEPCRVKTGDEAAENIPPGEYIKLVVADSGIGMSREDIKKIFDPFYSKKKMGRSGTGLGMTIVWTTTKDHDGHILINSIEGKGTTISLYFPVCQEEKRPVSEPALETIKGTGQSVLIIDDLPEQRSIASKMLKALNYNPCSAKTGEGGLHFIKTTPVDLVLLDMVLGGDLDGLGTYRKIKEIKPGLKVIIVSGLDKTQRIRLALAEGAVQYLKKPYTLRSLGAALKQEMNPAPES